MRPMSCTVFVLVLISLLTLEVAGRDKGGPYEEKNA